MKLNQAMQTVLITILILSVSSSVQAAKGGGKGKGGGGSGDGDTGGLTPVTITFMDDSGDRIGSDGFGPYSDGGADGVEAFLASKANFGNLWLGLENAPSRSLHLDFTDCAGLCDTSAEIFDTLSAIKVDANDVQTDGLFGMAVGSKIYPPMRVYYQFDQTLSSLDEEQNPGFIYFNPNIKGKSPCKNRSDHVEVYRDTNTLWIITGTGYPNTACVTLPGSQLAGQNLAGVFYMPFEFTVEINN